MTHFCELVVCNSPTSDADAVAIKHLVTGKEGEVCSSRLKFYADSSLDVTEEMIEHVASYGIVMAVDHLQKRRWNEGTNGYVIVVRWCGLEPIEKSWKPLRALQKDIPVMLDAYVNAAKNPELSSFLVQENPR
uniref:Chromo domain-containing protein n=1 Tax=Globisporangium ultimum (strain ATCC 200006 / CBS 805.95 / DAOM BR144) TaxID=431595 RepID=K3WVH4_GLOUD